jgi:cytochrome c-type biogenesis protein CcmH
MLFWSLVVLLTAAAILAVLAPLGRPAATDDAHAHARRVYRDQLKELERDKAEGRISPGEAEAARAEIARRLLALEDEAVTEPPRSDSGKLRRMTAVLALGGIPVFSLALYLMLGAPVLPGAPLAARLEDKGPEQIEALVAKVEQHLAENPEDGRGWDVIAPVYLRLGRTNEAVLAYQNAIRLLGSTSERQSGLGEAILVREGGIVTEEARSAFEAANALDSAAPRPRFLLGLAAEQEGRFDDAARMWGTLLAEASPDAPWRGLVEEALARVSGDAAPPSGPTDADIAAAEELSAGERTAMVEGMVNGLAERLKQQPDNVEGWLQLIRSYVVLGRVDAAAAAARDALNGIRETSARQRVEQLIAELGVTPADSATP